MTIRLTTVGAAWTLDGKHVGPGPWLTVIHECNRLTDSRAFGEPEMLNRGIYVERYPDADVEFRGTDAQDQLVTIVSRTFDGARLIARAARALNLRVEES